MKGQENQPTEWEGLVVWQATLWGIGHLIKN